MFDFKKNEMDVHGREREKKETTSKRDLRGKKTKIIKIIFNNSTQRMMNGSAS